MDNLNLHELSKKVREDGYEAEYADAKLCQDIILLLISKSKYINNVTIKGGVVMHSISNSARRATLDIDFDFINYSMSDESIKSFITDLNGIYGLKIKIVGKPEELMHQDYEGKRVHLIIEDHFNNILQSKIDVGVHKHLSIKQEEYCFNLSFDADGATLFINSKEQIFVEKLKSILKFSSLSTRFKDVYDMHYLLPIIDKEVLLNDIDILIFNDDTMRENNIEEIIKRIKSTFDDKRYLRRLSSSNKNWTDASNDLVLKEIIQFLSDLKMMEIVKE